MENKKELFRWTAGEIKQNKTNPQELILSLDDRINLIEDKVKAFTKKPDVLPDAVPQNSGLLCGIPVSIKDNICVQNEPTTCASKILSGFLAPYDAEVIRRLKVAGALLSKTA
jgi:aspartyl-tRNA(Asn)/glutamyl-tRNA(Gln) amidotransferase subunit A